MSIKRERILWAAAVVFSLSLGGTGGYSIGAGCDESTTVVLDMTTACPQAGYVLPTEVDFSCECEPCAECEVCKPCVECADPCRKPKLVIQPAHQVSLDLHRDGGFAAYQANKLAFFGGRATPRVGVYYTDGELVSRTTYDRPWHHWKRDGETVTRSKSDTGVTLGVSFLWGNK